MMPFWFGPSIPWFVDAFALLFWRFVGSTVGKIVDGSKEGPVDDDMTKGLKDEVTVG